MDKARPLLHARLKDLLAIIRRIHSARRKAILHLDHASLLEDHRRPTAVMDAWPTRFRSGERFLQYGRFSIIPEQRQLPFCGLPQWGAGAREHLVLGFPHQGLLVVVAFEARSRRAAAQPQ